MTEAGKKIFGLLREAGRRLTPDMIRKVPIGEINEVTVGRTILKEFYGPVSQKFGRGAYANPFSVVDVLVGLGHILPRRESDYYQEMEAEYRKARGILDKLVRRGSLERTTLKETLKKRGQDCGSEPETDVVDEHGEWQYYKVEDSERLKEVAGR